MSSRTAASRYADPIELLEAADEELRRDQAEAVRVAYVATTRARDLLVAPVCGDDPILGWLGVLKPVLYPPDDLRAKSVAADGCPSFGDDSVLDRGPEGLPPTIGSVRPGLHKPLRDGPNVVWWDPSVLTLEVEEHAPLRHQRILEVDATKTAANESEQDYAAWKSARTDLLMRASQPSISVQTVTALARLEASQQEVRAPVRVEMIERGDSERPSGRRFGALVHAILASLDLDASEDAIQASAGVNGRLVGATEEEVIAAVATVHTTLEHPILRRAAASAMNGGIRRETPVLFKLDDGSLVEGVVDLAFREDTDEFRGWTVVDFKTGREFGAASDQYSAQVSMYAEAVHRATGLSSRGVLLVV
jgi:ATP-dependent helicase/nuclease subunit A